MKNTIDTIIFDLGGVLVDWNPAYLYNKIFEGNAQKTTWFLNNVCTTEWNTEQDSGRTIEEAEKVKIEEFPEYENLIKLYYKEWHNMFSGPIEKNVELLQKLKASKKYRIYALTNWSAEKWEMALQLFPFFKEFEGVVVSGQEKTRKPFPEIYTTILNRYKITPEKAVFIDDNKENVVAAAHFKINAIHYTNFNELKKSLNSLQIFF